MTLSCPSYHPDIDSNSLPHSPTFPRSPQSVTSAQGTTAYMAPEQYKPQESGITSAADVWAFGATLVHMLTGAPPFPSLHPYQIPTAVADHGQAPQLPAAVASRCSTRLVQVVQACCQASPAARPSAGQVLERLQAILAAEVRQLAGWLAAPARNHHGNQHCNRCMQL
jgi:serine/threonine protein kinase